MKNILITGATGMIGTIVLQEFLRSKEFGKAIYEVGVKGTEKTIIENKNIPNNLENA